MHKHKNVLTYIESQHKLKIQNSDIIWQNAAVDSFFLSLKFWEKYPELANIEEGYGKILYDIFLNTNDVYPQTEKLIRRITNLK